MRPELIKAVALGMSRFLLLWFGTLLVGFPLVVLALGFKLREGWALVAAHPKLVVVVVATPLIFLVLGLFNQFISSIRTKR